jgi:hypothetical protein
VLYLNGREQYLNVRRNGRPLKGSPIASGTWSTGEFGTVLQDLFSPASNAKFVPRDPGEFEGKPARIYDYAVEQPNSHWRIDFEGRTIYPAYEGAVWIDPESRRVLRIEMKARDLAADYPMDTIESALDYGEVAIGDQVYLLVKRAENLSCRRWTTRCSRNELEFSNYRKFTAESTVSTTDSTITFEGDEKAPSKP